MTGSLRTTVTLAVLLAFGAGAAIGALVNRPARTPAAQTYLQDLEDRYGLADDQVTRIRTHLDDEDRRIEAILAAVEDQVKADIRAVRADVQQKIRAELTDSQRQAFDRDAAGS